MSKTTEEKDCGWLIHKAGRGWYRPNAEGYTNDTEQAGRYSHADARSHSHPNGWDGPRDGITIKHESELRSGGEEKNGVGVKPVLDWMGNEGGPGADIVATPSPYICYRIRHLSPDTFDVILNTDTGDKWFREDGETHTTYSSAKSFCAADYRKRTALTNTDLSLRAENERLRKEIEDAVALAERLKLEAQGHACEARTANATIYEIYQVLSGSSGEPGNWNGAEPARAFVAETKAKLEEAAKVLEPFARAAGYYARDGLNDKEFVVNSSTRNRNGEEVEAALRRGDFRAANALLANLKGAE